MITIDSVLKSIEVLSDATATTTELSWTSDYVNTNLAAETIAIGDYSGLTTGTTAVTVIPAPAVNEKTELTGFTIINNDTVSHRVTVRLNNNSVYSTYKTAVLLPGEELIFAGNWSIYDADGYIKTSSPLYVSDAENLGVTTNGLFAQKLGSVLQFKSLVAGANITMTASATEVEIESSAMTNPMTTIGDLILGDTAGAAIRLGIGTNTQVLTSNGTTASWQTPAAGFTNPMTTLGDLIIGDTGGAAIRLPIGANGYVLTSNGTTMTWAAAAVTVNGANPTAQVGLTAVNGVATTYLRSDGAPALDVGISPTWTGTHTFSNTIVGAINGNAATATALQTARNINGVAFDGTANITVTAAAGTLTGTTLNATVVSSSLTSVGTLVTGLWNASVISEVYGGTNQSTFNTGDILYASAANTLSKLAAGTNGHFMKVAAGIPSWSALTSGEITTALSYTPVDVNGDTMTGYLILNGDPVTALGATTKQYVDAVATGLDLKGSCRVATTANITLSGAQTIDGVSAIAGDRVLVKNQSTGADNGIYVVAAGAWSRSTDADASAEVTSGMYTYISEGSTQGQQSWVLVTPDPITLGTTSLTFSQFSGAGTYVAGAGLTLTGNSFSISTITDQYIMGNNAGSAAAPVGLSASTVKTILSLSNVENTAISTWAGSSNIITVGTITTGTWQATAIADTYIASAATWNAKLTSVLTDTYVFVGNGSNVATGVAISGDVTISNTGVVSIGNDKVLTTHILNSNVTLAKIANIADQTILGNNTGGAAAPVALTATQTKTVLSLNNVENTALSTWAGTANITTLGTITTGTWSGTAIAATKGGTGQTTIATGDILYGSASNVISKLAAGTDGDVLTLASGIPTWAAGGGLTAATVWASVLAYI